MEQEVITVGAIKLDNNFKEEKMNKVWMISGSTCQQVDSGFSVKEKLPVGIYSISLTKQGWFLERFANKFVFDYKIYGLQNEFITHVLRTYENTTGNLGIILTGTKGTGKTVTAKELANKLNLPIIIVKDMEDYNQAMIEYLSGLACDCVLFMDEFEKNFKEEDSTVLQIMDGVYNSTFRKIFLLTTNQMAVNDNLISRPSRIRYVKQFGNLELSTVEEYLNDTLLVKEAKQELINFIDSLSVSTIDILKAIVSEVNIHGINGLGKAKSFFNISSNEYNYSCMRGYVYKDEYIKNPNVVSMVEFMKAVEKYNNPIAKPIVQDEANVSPEEQKLLNEWYEYRRHNFHSFNYSYVDSDVRFGNLKPGDLFNEETVASVDKKLGVVVTDYEECYYYYWVKNPNSKPSLYNKISHLVF